MRSPVMGLGPGTDDIQHQGCPPKTDCEDKENVEVARLLDKFQLRPGEASTVDVSSQGRGYR